MVGKLALGACADSTQSINRYMDKILITGATGQFGYAITRKLLGRIPSSRIVVLARDASTANTFSRLGVEVRYGDYRDRSSLAKALRGVRKLMFVPRTGHRDGLIEHLNVVDAASKFGVDHLFYAAIQHPMSSRFVIPHATEHDRLTIAALKQLRVRHTVLRCPLFLDALPFMLSPYVLTEGIKAPAGPAGGALALRAETAEAVAILLSEDVRAEATFQLGGNDSISMPDIADMLSRMSGRTLAYQEVSKDVYIRQRTEEGLPAAAARSMANWFAALGAGEFSEVTGDMENLLGRKPASAASFFQSQCERVRA